MTLYAEAAPQPLHAPTLTKIFNVMVWMEMDRVRVDSRHYTLTLTGRQSDRPEALIYEIDGHPATMQEVGDLIAWAKQDGSIEKIAEEVAA